MKVRSSFLVDFRTIIPYTEMEENQVALKLK